MDGVKLPRGRSVHRVGSGTSFSSRHPNSFHCVPRATAMPFLVNEVPLVAEIQRPAVVPPPPVDAPLFGSRTGAPVLALAPQTARAVFIALSADVVDELAVIAIATAERMAALTARAGAVAAVDAAALRLRRGSFTAKPPGNLGFEVGAVAVAQRRGSVAIVDVADAVAAAETVSGQAPCVIAVCANDALGQLLDALSPTSALVFAGDETSASYLDLAGRDLAGRLATKRVITARFGDVSDDDAGRGVVSVHREPSAVARLRWGRHATQATMESADTLARAMTDGA